MNPGRGELGRIASFGLIAVIFAVTRPLVLIGLPLAVLIIAFGPRRASMAFLAGAIVTLAFIGQRSGLWWFERGWPLLLAGAFVWVRSWRPGWRFTAQALAALGCAAAVAVLIFAASPGAWLAIDASMAVRGQEAATAMLTLLGDRADEAARGLVSEVTAVQVALFPALLGVSSLGALGVAVSVRDWLAGEAGRAFGRLRGFRFNDHLVWIWLAGLVLILAPLGGAASRVGSNAVVFMGALYVLRGMAVLLSLVGGISVLAGVVGGVVAIVLYPILALLLGTMLIVGLGDTWLDVRRRVKKADDAP